MRSLGLPSAVLALCVALLSCGSDVDTGRPAASRAVVITIRDNHDGGRTGLKIGHLLRIELPANPSTGRCWSVAAVDEAVLEPPAMEEYELPESDALGAAGVSVWIFKAVGAGEAPLKLAYGPVGADADGLPLPPEKTFTFRVIVD